jgi:hypothetical protein
MVFHGRVIGGAVVIDPPGALPEGAEVQVHVVGPPPATTGEPEIPSLYDRFKDIIGQAKDLPPDFAAQHDHYIHGTPKR